MMTLSGDGVITGLVAGGLPDGVVQAADMAAAAVSAATLDGAQTGAAPIYGCRAWCVFDGTLTGTNAPLAGGNVTSVTRNSTGDYTVNFTVAMSDANYCVLAKGNANNMGVGAGYDVQLQSPTIGSAPTLKSTTQFRIVAATVAPTITLGDLKNISVAVFR